MGASSSKQPQVKLVDPALTISYKKDEHEQKTLITIRKCVRRMGKITVFDDIRDDNMARFMFEFEKGADENVVWDFVSASIASYLKEYECLYVVNNFLDAYKSFTFSEKTMDDMRVHVTRLVRFMLLSSSIYCEDDEL